MDELKKYGIKELRDGLTLNRIKKDFSWLLKAKIKDAILGIDKNKLVWYDGAWYRGTWYDGFWYNGTWYDGTWHDGIWHKGIWHNGIWHNGIWHNGIWKDGFWYSGKFIDGKVNKIIIFGGKFKDLNADIVYIFKSVVEFEFEFLDVNKLYLNEKLLNPKIKSNINYLEINAKGEFTISNLEIKEVKLLKRNGKHIFNDCYIHSGVLFNSVLNNCILGENVKLVENCKLNNTKFDNIGYNLL